MTREEAIEKLERRLSTMKFLDDTSVDSVNGEALEIAIKALKEGNAQEVKHGKWVYKGHFTLMCSCCEHYVSRELLVDYETMNFCPNCGAKMNKEENNE